MFAVEVRAVRDETRLSKSTPRWQPRGHWHAVFPDREPGRKGVSIARLPALLPACQLFRPRM